MVKHTDIVSSMSISVRVSTRVVVMHGLTHVAQAGFAHRRVGSHLAGS